MLYEVITGISSATAIVAVRPGIPPTTTPATVPMNTARRDVGVRRERRASTIMTGASDERAGRQVDFEKFDEDQVDEREHARGGQRHRQRAARAGRIHRERQEARRGEEEAERFRITSYNVCYTKLLRENGFCRVQLSDGHYVTAAAVNIAGAGAATTLSMRPEKVHIEGYGPDHVNRLMGTVKETIYHGDHVRIRLAVAGNPDFVVRNNFV